MCITGCIDIQPGEIQPDLRAVDVNTGKKPPRPPRADAAPSSPDAQSIFDAAEPTPPPPEPAAPDAPPPPEPEPPPPEELPPPSPDAPPPLPPDAPPPPPDAPPQPDAPPPPPDAPPPPPDAPPQPDASDPEPDAALPPEPETVSGVTDLRAVAPPPLDLPPAGGSYVDPVFGTTILRVTDERDGTRCNHAYSYWPAFNADGKRLLIACDDVPRLYRFDRATDTLTPDGTLRGSDGPNVRLDGATWSRSMPDAIWATDTSGTRLWLIDVSRRGLAGYTLVKDFGAAVGTGLRVHQLTVSHDEQVFSFHTRTSTGTKQDAFVWYRPSDVVYKFSRPAGWALDESHVAKDGNLVLIAWKAGHVTVWDYLAGTSTDLLRDATDRVSGHFDIGNEVIANSDGWSTGILVRNWDTLHAPRNVVQYRRPSGALNWSIADHVSLRADDERWVMVSTYAGDNSWAPFEDEIFLVRADGGGFVRLAHTRSYQLHPDSGMRYYAEPRAVIDRVGRYIVYTSDLGSSSRMDVMILKVPAGIY